MHAASMGVFSNLLLQIQTDFVVSF